MLKTTFLDHRGALVSALIGLLVFPMFACDSSQPWRDPGPDEAFERFLLDWHQNKPRKAFEAIAPEDRRRLLEPYDELEKEMDEEELPERHEMLPAGRVENPYDLADIEVAESLEEEPEDGERVTLELSYHDERKGEATMVWRGERWYVDLPIDDADEDSEQGR
ncbi:MAG: hypothetical protein ACOCV2_01335 [Persicimonas sp.]